MNVSLLCLDEGFTRELLNCRGVEVEAEPHNLYQKPVDDS